MKWLKKHWISFWGRQYRVYKNDKEIYRALIYKRKVFVEEVKENE